MATVVKMASKSKLDEKTGAAKIFTVSEVLRIGKRDTIANWPEWTKWPKWSNSQRGRNGQNGQNGWSRPNGKVGQTY